MKRIAFYLLAVCFFLGACKRVESDIPVFNLLLSDSSTIVNTGRIPAGKIIMFVFFSPDCEYCQDETIDLIKNMEAVKSIQFYFVSLAAVSQIHEFVEFYKLGNYANITVGKDYTSSFPKLSGVKAIPTSIIYDREGQLRVVIKGGFTVKQLLEKIEQL